MEHTCEEIQEMPRAVEVFKGKKSIGPAKAGKTSEAHLNPIKTDQWAEMPLLTR
jgi:hypothetical protein